MACQNRFLAYPEQNGDDDDIYQQRESYAPESKVTLS